MAENIQLPGEFDDDNDFWKHPKYDNYEANRLGIVRHVVNKKDVGYISNTGYFRVDIWMNGNRKRYLKHRLIYESFYGLITDKMVVDHINNIKTDNRLQNLQLITSRENTKKDNKKIRTGLPMGIRAINIKSGDIIDYESIGECARRLDIIHCSINRILKGDANSATSKKDNNIYTFERLGQETNKKPIKVRATNINTEMTSDYNTIKLCSKILDINQNSIRNIIKGIQNTAKSKKDNCKYTFEKMN